jgi:hypothetical protein
MSRIGANQLDFRWRCPWIAGIASMALSCPRQGAR